MMDGPFRDLSRLRSISITQIVFGILGLLGMLGGVKSLGSSTAGTFATVFGFFHMFLIVGTGILGVLIVNDCRFRNYASSGKFLASVVCSSILATLSILGAIGCTVGIALFSTLLSNLPIPKNNLERLDRPEVEFARIIVEVALVVYVVGLLFSVMHAVLSIVAAKIADGNRLIVKFGLKSLGTLDSKCASDYI